MDEIDFEGTIILERMAEIEKLDEFFDAIDLDDFEKVRCLLRKAGIDSETIQMVMKKMSEADGQH